MIGLVRKLRCSGEKPACDNCSERKFECVYAPVQRRRGPGKVQKGSRPKKIGAGCLNSKAEPSSVFVNAEHELDILPPQMRQYMAVLQGMVAT